MSMKKTVFYSFSIIFTAVYDNFISQETVSNVVFEQIKTVTDYNNYKQLQIKTLTDYYYS